MKINRYRYNLYIIFIMQLFIATGYIINKQIVHISEERIIYQCHTVLRMKEGDQLFLQNKDGSERHSITIQLINKKEVIGQISYTTTHSQSAIPNPKSIICVALPNRMDKAELIIQKLSEIGTSQIIFFVATRSKIRELKEKTITRLESIALEATEQSLGRSLPKISYSSSFSKLLEYTDIEDSYHILLDHNGKNREERKKHIHTLTKNIYAYIGPEGGFTQDEKQAVIVGKSNGIRQSVSLGSNNLRMETAAIITGRLSHNNSDTK